jgi:hypothetical protein
VSFVHWVERHFDETMAVAAWLTALATIGAGGVAFWYVRLTRRLARTSAEQTTEIHRQADITLQMFQAAYRPTGAASSSSAFGASFTTARGGTIPWDSSRRPRSPARPPLAARPGFARGRRRPTAGAR